MEFPEDLSTNCFELTGVSEVSWTLLRLLHENRYAEHNDEDIEATRLVLLTLADIEHQLCRDGLYAILDIDEIAIWAFTLSETKRKSLIPLIEDLQLEAASSGVLSTWHLDGSSLGSRRPSGIPGLVSSNSDAFNANASLPAIDETSSSTSYPKDVIYRRFTQAISHSLALSLTSTSGWLLYGATACIRELSLGLDTVDSIPDTQLAIFKTRWHPSGTLLVQVVPNKIAKLYRVSQVYEMDHSLQIGDELLILPSAAHGTFLGIEPRVNSHKRRSQMREIQNSVKGELEDIGLSTAGSATWIRVGLDGTGENEHGVEITFTLWPAQYCICTPPQVLANPFHENSDAVDPTSDPIQRAKEWYDQRFERAKAIEEEKQRIEQEAQEAKRKQAKEQQETLQMLSPLDHRGDIQDVSGVYPTPPDGPPSQNHDTPKQAGTHDSSEIGGIEGSFTNTPYNFNQEQDDLFGDHDIDLTEADFDFFDEPSPGQNEEAINRGSLAQDDSASHLDATPEAKDSSFKSFNAMQSPDDTGRKAVEQTQLASCYVRESTNTAKPHFSPPLYSETEPNLAATAMQHNDEVNQDDPLATSIDMSNNAGPVRRLEVYNEDIDTKYSSKGRFAFPLERMLSKEITVQEANQKSAGIPQLGLLDGSASDTEESLEQGSIDTPETSSRGDPMEVDDDHLIRVSQPTINVKDEGSPFEAKGAPEQVFDSCVLPPVQYLVADTDSERPSVAFSRSEDYSRWSVSDERLLIQVAQLVIDYASERQPFCDDPQLSAHNPFLYYDTTSHFLEIIQEFMLDALPHSRIRTLKEFAHPEAMPGNKGRMQNGPLSIQSMDHPYTLIRRIDTSMDVLPSALSFWEEFGLQPASGSKDVVGVCIAPNLSTSKHLWKPIRNFLEMMSDAYQACNLGTLEVLNYEDGEYDPAQNGGYSRIGSILSQVRSSEQTLVAHILDDGSRMLPEICAQALELLNAYTDGRRKSGVHNTSNLVIQILPQKLVFSSHQLVVPTFDIYKSLAFEIYNKCSPIKRESSRPPCICAPAVSLSKSLPDRIDFKLATDPAAATLYDDNRIHVAYVFNPEDEWITASWTDNLGILQWSAAYCNGVNTEDPWEPFKRLANEILETTLDMLQPQSRTWRVFVAKAGQLLKQELRAWQFVLSSRKSPIREYIILGVDDNPDLQTSMMVDRTSGLNEAVDYLATPVQTPSATGHSPEASLPTPTPSGTGFSQDPDTRLIDVRDETWIFQPKYSIDDPFRTTEFCKPQASGYLVKRHDKDDKDGLDALAVMLVHHEEKQSNAIMREILEMYHKLSVLARVRNPAQAVKALLPLHIGAARKGHAAVSGTMRRE